MHVFHKESKKLPICQVVATCEMPFGNLWVANLATCGMPNCNEFVALALLEPAWTGAFKKSFYSYILFFFSFIEI